MHALAPDALSHRHGRQRLASRYRRQHRRRAPQRSIVPCIAPAVVEGEVITIRDDYQAFAPPPKPRKRVPMMVVAMVAVLSLALGTGLALWVSPVFLATATITLTPETHALDTAASIQVAARLFPADHVRLSRTVSATGTATLPATSAHGVITFYNALPAPQTIPAGTLLTSVTGVPVLTEDTAYIPAATPPTEGATTVSAQAENTGPVGNIAAGTIGGPCCRAYVLAYNGGFWGGADARTYRTPTALDIATALAPLRSQVDSRVQDALHAWPPPGEVLIAPKCQTRTSTSAQPGAEADHITVTVAETCTAAAYSEGELHQATLARLGELASQQFGPAYRLVSDARTEITGATVTSDHVTLRLRVSGLYAYSFSERQLAQLRAQLAGVSRDRASVMLLQLAGVTRVRLQSGRDILPGDPSRIQILLSQ